MPSGLTENYEELSDEETPLNQEIYGGSRRSTAETTKAWDSFRNLPPENSSLSEETQDYMGVTVKILKIFTYLLTFSVVLGCSVITKGLVLLMTSQLQVKKRLTVCSDSYKMLHNEKDYEATIPPLENVAWAWMLFFCFIIPELGTWFRSFRMCLFKTWKKPLGSDFLLVFFFETLHVLGTALLIFKVLPEVDVIKGAMLTNCFCFIPGLFGMFSRTKGESHVFIKVIVDIVALSFQMSAFFIWPLVEYRRNPSKADIWLIPIAILLISFGWWENYVDKQSKFRPIKYLGRIKERMWRSRYFIYAFVSLWKCVVFFGLMVLFMYSRLQDFTVIFRIGDALSAHIINVTELRPPSSVRLPDISQAAPLENIIKIPSDGSTPVTIFMLLVLSSYLAYIFAKFACKICIQGFSFAFPVNLTVPVSISLLISACGLRLGKSCYFESLPSYLFWECKGGDILEDFLSEDYAWMWLFWLLSQTWITLHIWTPKCERLASTEKLFVAPMYNALFIDQSLALNRRRDDDAEVKTDDINLNADENEPEPQYYETISNHTDSSNTNNPKSKSSDHITRIYATTTMWHETEEEMMEVLKSILRMDEDQSARRITQKYLEVVDPDYYEFETHILFDDAFEVSDDNEDEHVVNAFVRLLVDKIDEAATHVHQISIRIRPPKKYPAPYGGRLVWTLPGKTKIICHMKDKDKIRHKKRWSQVMYMYYLLGFRLMELPIPVDRKEVIAENTYLLTLDGDIDFTPKAVHLLVDLMKKNRNLGAACGRIHPVGSGIMVWYQMFEYAIGHWLQKATEHMIGCVMCSPGCFSLFRGKALMDDNVMAKYTTTSSQARHYVQYDQGEDRWLCTLLLQRGYRVEYSAASDAYTHCPEGFSEFYNQRRRWVPSTMANIMDLLQEYKKTIQINDNISLPYICYQTMLMGGTILGPGTIFLMLVGAFVAAFKIGNWPSFQYNIYPILFFMVVCFTLKSQHQVIVAQIMSAAYGLIMMAVIVGTTLQLGEDGVGSPSFIFLIALSGSFFIAACMHPQEFNCIIPGLLYLLSIPSMYLLLIIYSLINLNNVSWGTREVATKKTKKEQEKDRKQAEEAKKKHKQDGLLGFLYRDNDVEDEGSIELSVAGLFKLMFCVHKKPDERKFFIDALDDLKRTMGSIEASLGLVPPHHRRRSDMSTPHHNHRRHDSVSHNDTEDFSDDQISQQSGPKIERDDLVNPFWLEDKCLKRGVVGKLDEGELQFWKDLIEKYLHPLNKNVEEQRKMESELKNLRNISVFTFMMLNAIFVLIVFLLQLNKDQIHVKWPLGIKQNITIDPTTQEARVAKDLKDLRNKSVFSFFMLNALFILVVFLLQLNKDEIHVEWPLGVKENITIIEGTDEILIHKEHLHLEPIGLVFVFFFALILVIQFVAMLFHRFGTISHILASTELNLCSCSKKPEEMTPESKLEVNAVRLVKDMQRLKGFDGGGDGDEEVARRHPIANIERHRQKKQPIGTLDVAFMKRFYSISKENGEGTPILGDERRENLRALFEKRKPKVQTLDYRKNNKTRTPLASEADHQRVFTPVVGSINDGYETENELYGAPPSIRSSKRSTYGQTDKRILFNP